MRVRWAWVFLDLPEGGFAEAVEFWRAVTRSSVSPWRGDHHQFATLLPEQGDAWVKVQRVGGGGGIHVDLDVDVPLADARDLAVSRGATVLDEVLDQVCLDIPRDRYAAEVEFWSALTGWAVQDVDSPEFGRLERPRELPVRFLLQQLGEGSGTVRGDVDLACADVAGEVARHAGLGANTVGPGDGWVVMQDPNGQEYCCTGRDPLTGGTAPD